MMKDRKKMAAELHHRGQEGNGTSMIFGSVRSVDGFA